MNNLTNKKVAFLVERNLYYKFFSPWIEKLLKNNAEVHLIHYSNNKLLSSTSGKLFYYPQLNQIPQFSKSVSNIHRIEDLEGLNNCLTKNNFDFVFSLHPKTHYSSLKTNAKWITMQHGVDSTKYKDQTTDHYIVYSKKWFEESDLSKSQVHEAGLYYSEQESMDRNAIAARYNLSPDKKYVLFVPLPVGTYQSYFFWPFKWFNRFILNYLIKRELSILKELKAKFDKTNTEILLKSRFKRFLPDEYHKFGTVFYDDMFYPCTTNDLVYLSDHVYINYMPGAILTEIAAFKKPFTYIHYPKLDKYTFGHIHGFMKNAFMPDESFSRWVHHSDISSLQNYSSRNQSLSSNYVEAFVTPPGKKSLDEILNGIL